MVIENFASSSPYRVSWYIFDIGIILISLRVNEYFSFRDNSNTYVTVMEWFGQRVELSTLISFSQHLFYEGHLESKERFAIKKYLLIIGKKKNMQVLSHTFTYFST